MDDLRPDWRDRRTRELGKQCSLVTVEGTFMRYGGDARRRLKGGRTRKDSTALFKNVMNARGEILADHLWVKNNGALNGLRCGQQVRFSGRVRLYSVRFKDRLTGLDAVVKRKTIDRITDVKVIAD